MKRSIYENDASVLGEETTDEPRSVFNEWMLLSAPPHEKSDRLANSIRAIDQIGSDFAEMGQQFTFDIRRQLDLIERQRHAS